VQCQTVRTNIKCLSQIVYINTTRVNPYYNPSTSCFLWSFISDSFYNTLVLNTLQNNLTLVNFHDNEDPACRDSQYASNKQRLLTFFVSFVPFCGYIFLFFLLCALSAFVTACALHADKRESLLVACLFVYSCRQAATPPCVNPWLIKKI
jgi:hypothetical protein